MISALAKIELWQERKGGPSLIVAAPTAEKLRTQKLPEHLRITSRKRCGKRVIVRERRHYYESNRNIAHWPDDGLVESPLPLLACVVSGQADLIAADSVFGRVSKVVLLRIDVLNIEFDDGIVDLFGFGKANGLSLYWKKIALKVLLMEVLLKNFMQHATKPKVSKLSFFLWEKS